VLAVVLVAVVFAPTTCWIGALKAVENVSTREDMMTCPPGKQALVRRGALEQIGLS
jgi:hypothetical protein